MAKQSDGTTADAVARVRRLVAQLSDAVAGLDGGAAPEDEEQPEEAEAQPAPVLPWRPTRGKPASRR